MKTTITLLLLTALLSSTNCIGPALAARGKVNAHDREGFAKANIEREAAGLPPLTKDQYLHMESATPTTVTTSTAPSEEPVTHERHVIIR